MSSNVKEIILPDLCDEYPEKIRVLEPMFGNFGGKEAFAGKIVTIKCFEDNSLVAEQVSEAGKGQVLVVDGGASLRCALVGDNLAQKAIDNGWQGIIIYGCVRDVDILSQLDIGVQALATHPMRSQKRNIGFLNETLNFAGVEIIPGEYLYADNNGIFVSDTDLLA